MLSPVALATALLLSQVPCSDNGTCPPSVSSTAAALSTGVLTTGYSSQGGALADAFIATGVEGRYRPGDTSLFIAEGALTGLLPISRDGSVGGIAGVARVGMAFTHISFALGVRAQWDPVPTPFSILPSARLTYQPGNFAFTLGLLDRAVGPVARLTVQYKNFGLGYAAPLGGEAFASFPLRDLWWLTARVHGYQLFNSFSVGAFVGVAFGKAPL